MKILSIKIKNLASIGEAFIDFTAEPLASTGIFAITGPTGAGKSTILDAMCLALYGKTPRYDLARESGVDLKDISGHTISQGDVKSILREGAASGFAVVVFVGLDKHHYSAEWHVKRSRESVTGKLQPETIILTNLNTGAILGQRKTETLAAIEKIIGLNFHQFTRSVLLAQGDFTAFLKADKDSKASLLEKLTGTEIYSEISRSVFEKSKEAGIAIKELSIQIEGIGILEDKELQALAEEQESISHKLVVAGNNSKRVEADLHWYNILESLVGQRAQAEKSKQEAENTLEALSERKLVLSQVEEVQAIKTNFDHKEKIIRDLQQKKGEQEVLALSIATQQNELAEIRDNIEKLTEKITAHKEQRKKYLPLLSEARRLDTLLVEKESRVKQMEADYDKQKANEKAQKAVLAVKHQEINEHKTFLETLEKWYAENKMRQPVAENITLIHSKLKDGSAQLKGIYEENEKLKDCENKIKIGDKEVARLREEMQQLSLGLHTTSRIIEAYHEKISGISIEELNASAAKLTELRTHYIKAASHWHQLYETEINCKTLDQKWKELNLQVEARQDALIIQTVNLDKAKIEKEYAAKTLARAQLQAAENVESLRAQLKDGEECPVCGSLDHPFVLLNPQLDFLLENLEKDSLERNEAYELTLNACTGLKTSIQNTRQSMEETQREKEGKEKLRHKLKADWLALPLDKVVFEIAGEEVGGWIMTREKEITAEISVLQNQVNEYNTVKKQWEAAIEEKNQAEMALRVINDRLNEGNNDIRFSREMADQAQRGIQKGNLYFEEITRELNPFFQHSNWVENWKSNDVGFTDKINSFARAWVENKQLLEEHRQQLNQLVPLTSALQKQWDSLLEESAKKQQDLEMAVLESVELLNKRMKIFGGENAETVEDRLEKVLESLEASLAINIKRSEGLKTSLTTRETQAENLGKTLLELEENHTREIQSINKWLEDFNNRSVEKLTPGLLPALMNYGPGWIKEERAFFEKVNRVIVETASLYREKCRMVAAHQAGEVPENTLDQLRLHQAEHKKIMEALLYRKNEIQIIQNQQETHKAKFATLQSRLVEGIAAFEKWSKLNDLIGSADGRKFRSIAQEYTLDILLLHANHHLEFLSKRYVLSRIEDTLGLQVADLDMGGEIRTVYSLSGGESFLVSLALALGLASLSADKMQVESLFIDEGFGSLDPQTLDMAMDALDRLHQQGRKVGVISHVQEMKERITTQIQVEKMANGKSKVVIVC